MVETSIVIPTLNEAQNVEAIVERIQHAMKGTHFEILFVDSGSTDGTIEKIKTVSQYTPNVRLLYAKKGVTRAVIKGIRESRGKYVVVIDADLQHPPEKIPEILSQLRKGVDIVVCSRYAKGGKILGIHPARRLISKWATILTRLIIKDVRFVKDPLSGFFGINKVRVVPPETNIGGFKVLLEILIINRHKKIVEIPYTFRSRKKGRSKLSISVVFWLIAQWVRYIWYSMRSS